MPAPKEQLLERCLFVQPTFTDPLLCVSTVLEVVGSLCQEKKNEVSTLTELTFNKKMVNNITKKWLINSQEKLQGSCYVGIKTGYGVSDELDPLVLRKASLRR